MSRPGAPCRPQLETCCGNAARLCLKKSLTSAIHFQAKSIFRRARKNFGTNRALSLVMARFTFVALFALGTADALALGGNRRRLLKLGSAAGLLGGGVERLAGRGAATAAAAPTATGATNSVVRAINGTQPYPDVRAWA